MAEAGSPGVQETRLSLTEPRPVRSAETLCNNDNPGLALRMPRHLLALSTASASNSNRETTLALGPARHSLPERAPHQMASLMSSQLQLPSPTTILTVLITLRLVNVLTIRTFFQPDEYFQALEPAWVIAFGGDAGGWVTWEWKNQLRSSLHPRLFSVAYLAIESITKTVGLSPPLRADALIVVPKVVQGVFAGVGDWYTWRLGERVYGKASLASGVVLLMTVLSPWQWYVSTRTFSNSLETVLTVAALYHWPWRLLADGKSDKVPALSARGEISGLRISLLLAATAVLLRPTNLLIWFSVATLTVTRLTLDGDTSPITLPVLMRLVGEATLCGTLTLIPSAVSDYLFFTHWVFPPYQFLYFNVAKSLAVFYGANDWHYYASQGIPLLSFGALPFVVVGIWRGLGGSTPANAAGAAAEKSSKSGEKRDGGGEEVVDPVLRSNILRTLSFAAVTLMGALSLISHKEVRFIYPLLPAFHVLAAPSVVGCFLSSEQLSESSAVQEKDLQGEGKEKGSSAGSGGSVCRVQRKPLLSICLSINLVVGVYLSYFHAAAPMSVMDFLRRQWEAEHAGDLKLGLDFPASSLGSIRLDGVSPRGGSSMSTNTNPDSTDGEEGDFVVFLVPCHTSPWRSHLVYPDLTARALTCEPPLHTEPGSEEREQYQDETDVFYQDIGGFLGKGREEEWSLGWDGESARRWREALHGDDRGQGDNEKVVKGLPRFIVGFNGVEEEVRGYFEKGKGIEWRVELVVRWRGWNGLFSDDWKREGYLVVWEVVYMRET